MKKSTVEKLRLFTPVILFVLSLATSCAAYFVKVTNDKIEENLHVTQKIATSLAVIDEKMRVNEIDSNGLKTQVRQNSIDIERQKAEIKILLESRRVQ